MSGSFASDRLVNNMEMKGEFSPSNVRLVNKVLDISDSGKTYTGDTVELTMNLAGSLLELDASAGNPTNPQAITLADAKAGSEIYVYNTDSTNTNTLARTGSAPVNLAPGKVSHVVFVDVSGGVPKAVLMGVSA